MVMRETGSVSFWTEPTQGTYFFPAERRAHLRRRAARRRQRLQRLVVAGIVAAAALSGFLVGRALASGEVRQAPAEYVTVGEGDTLWDLAKKHGDRSLALTERLDALVAANPQVASGRLTPGQRLRLPQPPLR